MCVLSSARMQKYKSICGGGKIRIFIHYVLNIRVCRVQSVKPVMWVQCARLTSGNDVFARGECAAAIWAHLHMKIMIMMMIIVIDNLICNGEDGNAIVWDGLPSISSFSMQSIAHFSTPWHFAVPLYTCIYLCTKVLFKCIQVLRLLYIACLEFFASISKLILERLLGGAVTVVTGRQRSSSCDEQGLPSSISSSSSSEMRKMFVGPGASGPAEAATASPLA